MAKDSDATKPGVSISFARPYDFLLSLSAVSSFQPGPYSQDKRLRLPVRIDGSPVLIEVVPAGSETDELKAFSKPEGYNHQIAKIVEWVIFADLDLSPFYNLAARIAKLAGLISKLKGLKPMRPASLFEMAVIAITEQQISLAAAYHIRNRLVQNFGEPVDGLWVFPEPSVLAGASMEELRLSGLSRQKAAYIQELARKVAEGRLALDDLRSMDDDAAREMITGWRGFGLWSADYILVRGLARPDCVPVADIGIREVIGMYLGEGTRVTTEEATRKLEPFRPYRGLLAFYLLAHHRLKAAGSI